MNKPTTTRPLRPRLVRLPASGVTARLGDQIGEVVNIGLGGALLRLQAAGDVGSAVSLVLLRGPSAMTVPAVVLRATRDTAQSAGLDSWLVAVRFTTAPADLRSLISQLLHPAPTSDLTRWVPAPRRGPADTSPAPSQSHQATPSRTELP